MGGRRERLLYHLQPASLSHHLTFSCLFFFPLMCFTCSNACRADTVSGLMNWQTGRFNGNLQFPKCVNSDLNTQEGGVATAGLWVSKDFTFELLTWLKKKKVQTLSKRSRGCNSPLLLQFCLSRKQPHQNSWFLLTGYQICSGLDWDNLVPPQSL